MTPPNSLFFLSILIVCISTGVSLSSVKDVEQKDLPREEHFFPSSLRGLFKRLQYSLIRRELIDPVTTYPTTPITNPVTTPAPGTSSPGNSSPGIITVPSTNPVTVPPNSPSSTPGTNPPPNPVPLPNTNPTNPPGPITNPVTTPSTNPGGQPVTTYPSPTGVPGSTPVTNPVTSPTTNAPAGPGQSWCVAKSGVSQTALQAALDYACGIGGAECSAIQQGASCYNPNSLQYHASYAFNSYFQKNPQPTSCDFGGTAMLTNSNPSTGSCIFPASSSSSSSPTTTPPVSTSPTPATDSSSGAVPGSVTPGILNSSNPAFGSPTGFADSPNISMSMSRALQPFIECIIAVACIISGKFILEI